MINHDNHDTHHDKHNDKPVDARGFNHCRHKNFVLTWSPMEPVTKLKSGCGDYPGWVTIQRCIVQDNNYGLL